MKPNILIPFLLVLLITVFMGLDGLFIYIAEKTYTGTVTENSYQKGIDAFKPLKATDRTLKVDISYANQTLSAKVSCDNKLCDVIEEVEAKVMRPTTGKYDKLYHMDLLAPNFYAANIGELEKGQWEIRLRIKTKHDKYFSKRIFIADSQYF